MAGKTGRILVVIAYDIVSTRRRNRVVKLLELYGRRANYSVFECLLKKRELVHLQAEIGDFIDRKEDSVLYYPLCASCAARREEDGFRAKQQKKASLVI